MIAGCATLRRGISFLHGRRSLQLWFQHCFRFWWCPCAEPVLSGRARSAVLCTYSALTARYWVFLVSFSGFFFDFFF